MATDRQEHTTTTKALKLLGELAQNLSTDLGGNLFLMSHPQITADNQKQDNHIFAYLRFVLLRYS